MKEALREVSDIVERFERNIEAYRSPGYNETQLRREFIDPFFEALGWDIANKAGYAEQYKDVVHEDAIKIAGATKAPDYCFRVGGARKFFLETKKPSIDIKDQVSPAYQLRRYAWSAKLSLSILTDFEEMAVYNCRFRPKPSDKPSIGRVRIYNYTQYLNSFEEIYSFFSKESVLKGSFDKFAESERLKRGTAEVDAEFLKEIESWREVLAKEIAIRNPKLSVRELNYAVQLTIDRIIFLRMCEDRGIEKYGQIQSLLNGTNTYHRLRQIFYHADGKYNSGLFDFKTDRLTPELALDDKPLKEIFKNLYYPESPYEFSVLGTDILGHVYEQFLGKVIRLTEGHRAKVEEKPEVRKAGGVYYTPTYIVDYIVKNTVGKLCDGKTPKQISSLRILDPACGSGSFLLGAYQYLLDYHRDWYQKDGPTKHTKEIYQGYGGQWHLTTQEKKRILLKNVYGVDIDPQAVEVTKLSLLLKVMEGENQDTLERQMKLFKERALPDLGSNIKCGNSLIGPDFYCVGAGHDLPSFSVGVGHVPPSLNEEEMYRINPFDWQKEFPEIMKTGGFDVVIGNPPYGASLSSDETTYLASNFNLQDYQLDTYLLFVERSLALQKNGGFFGMIMPNTWLLNLQSVRIRQYLFTQTEIQNIVHYRRPVFSKATVDTQITVIKKKTPSNTHQVKICIVNRDGSENDYFVSQKRWQMGGGKPVNIFERPELVTLADKLKRLPILDKICVITQGAKPFQVGKGKPPQTRKIVEEKPFVSEKKKDSSYRPLLRGSLIQRYQILWDKNYWISFGDWLAEPRYSANYDAPVKMVIRQTGDSLIATLDRNQFIVRDNLYTIVSHKEGPDLRYVLGLLNSRLCNWFYQRIINPEKGEALAQVKRGHLAQLPIALPNLSNSSDKARHDQMVTLVEQMLSLHKQLAAAKTPDEKTRIQRQIDATDHQIDRLVYELYGLTEEEIRIVEDEEGK